MDDSSLPSILKGTGVALLDCFVSVFPITNRDGDALCEAHIRHADSTVAVRTTTSPSPDRLEWQRLPRTVQLYVGAVVIAGACAVVVYLPRHWPPLGLFAALVLASCLTSMWKVNLPIPLSSGSTLSVSFAANLAALLLLGPGAAILVAMAGAWTQCTIKVKRPYPLYRTAFSVAAEAVAMAATGVAYRSLGGQLAPWDFAGLARPLVGTTATYFVVNTGLVAAAIALSTRQSFLKIWQEDFLWSAASFTVVGTAGAAAAVVVVRGQHWSAILAVMPVYFAYRTYSVFVGRLEDERRHAAETERQHGEAVAALLSARRSEQALAEEKERLAVMLRSIGDGVIASDLDGKILLINRVAETLTGWSRDEAIGRPLGSVFQNVDPETRKRCDDSIRVLAGSAGGTGLRSSSLLVARDLSERPIEACATPLHDAQGHAVGMVLAFRDISDALRAQEQRASAGRLASLGLLAGGIAHDFNNILMAIMGNISMVRATTMQGAAAGAALAEAEQACVRARQITWQLLTFSKGGVPVKKSVDLPRVLDEAATLALRGSHVTSAFDLPADLWHIEADDSQLVQVFTNLLINAQQAMPHGGVVTIRGENIFEISRRSEHGLRVDPGAYVRVTVIDHGIGIPKEHTPRIFDPYFSTKQRGSGLGPRSGARCGHTSRPAGAAVRACSSWTTKRRSERSRRTCSSFSATTPRWSTAAASPSSDSSARSARVSPSTRCCSTSWCRATWAAKRRSSTSPVSIPPSGPSSSRVTRRIRPCRPIASTASPRR